MFKAQLSGQKLTRVAGAAFGIAALTMVGGCQRNSNVAETTPPPAVVDPQTPVTLPEQLTAGQVVISGVAKVGHTLTATPFGFNPIPASYDYTWYRGYEVIGHEQTYKEVAADAGKTLTVQVTANYTGESLGTGAVATATIDVAAETPTPTPTIPSTVKPMPMPTVKPILPSNPAPAPMPSVKPTVPSTPKPTTPTVKPTAKPSTPTPAPAPTDKPSQPAVPPATPAPAPSDIPKPPAETPKPAPAPADTPDPVPPVTPTPAPTPTTTLPAVIPPEEIPAPTPSPIPEETLPVVPPIDELPAPVPVPNPVPSPCISALPGLGVTVGDQPTTKAKAKTVDTGTDNANPCGLPGVETPSLQTPGLTLPVTELSTPLTGTKHLPLMKAPKLGPQFSGGKVAVTQDGNVLTAAVTGFDPEPTSLDYQWFANDDLVPGATNATFDAGNIEAGDHFAVRVIAHRAGYTDRLIAGYFNLDLPTGLVRR